ncbi:MAG: M20/M25/M40 family metallo-hydrolase [Clostridiales bacterium]|nr:M20/M25/M40 family metallo-hydrolase [Clostridiales bacterium]
MQKQQFDIQEICDYIDSKERAMTQLWEQMVRIESPSARKDEVNRLAAHLDTYLDAMGLQTRKVPFEEAGSSLVAHTEEGELPAVALMAHMDTVHPVGRFGADVFRREGDKIYGPGVYDCKGGIAVAILVISALQHFGYRKRQLRLILSGDEEVAHSLSNGDGCQVYADAAAGCAAAFNCESGLLNGDVICRRKGGGIVTIGVHGVSAHAGKEPEKGASAIREAARKILKIEELSDPSKVLYNCGVVKGGTSSNAIPDLCELTVGIRFPTNQDLDDAMETLQKICDDNADPRIHAKIERTTIFKAMEPVTGTEQLLHLYQDACEQLGFSRPQPVYSGGCSDAAYVTMLGIPVLCGVGVRGDASHTINEYAVASSLTEQAKKIVLTILRMENASFAATRLPL